MAPKPDAVATPLCLLLEERDRKLYFCSQQEAHKSSFQSGPSHTLIRAWSSWFSSNPFQSTSLTTSKLGKGVKKLLTFLKKASLH
jgi:hypothetical protein